MRFASLPDREECFNLRLIGLLMFRWETGINPPSFRFSNGYKTGQDAIHADWLERASGAHPTNVSLVVSLVLLRSFYVPVSFAF
jgi:hypothetical protein